MNKSILLLNMNKSKYRLLILFIFINIFKKVSLYILIPFKTYKPKRSIKYNNIAEDFFETNLNNTIYIEIDAGIPTQKIPALILSEEFGFFIMDHKCLIPSSFETIEKSNTFWKSEHTGNKGKNIIFGNDIFEFPTESSTKKQAKLNFIYSQNLGNDNNNNNINKFTCAGVGISGAKYYGKNYEKNLVNQLLDENIINNNLFSIIYSEEDEGIFLIGSEPHKYYKNSQKYSKKNLIYINNDKNNNFIFWSLLPESIYFSLNKKIINISNNYLNNSICTLEYNLGLIYGTEDYLNLIKENYFNQLFLEKKCYEKIIYSFYTIIYCDKREYIENFPNLNFHFPEIIFTLNEKDLFLEKNGKFFFGIIFDRKNKNQWKLGKPFLKKYSFIFNYDTKKIGIYNEQLNKENKLKKFSYIIVNILVTMMVSFFCYIGFYYMKKVYNKAIDEKEDEYEYKYKSREERAQVNSYIELMVESKVLDE